MCNIACVNKIVIIRRKHKIKLVINLYIIQIKINLFILSIYKTQRIQTYSTIAFHNSIKGALNLIRKIFDISHQMLTYNNSALIFI